MYDFGSGQENYRTYLRISRGFLDSILIEKRVGRSIKVYPMKLNLGFNITIVHSTRIYLQCLLMDICDTIFKHFFDIILFIKF